MKDLKRNLPPLTSLVAFEAAARLGSFSAAAAELNVTREAVSRQIRAIEAHLGVKLFERNANTAKTGALGARFFATVSPNLQAIAAAAIELGGQDRIESAPEHEDSEDARDDGDATDLPSILIVDDSPENIHHLYGLLRAEYQVIAQTSGADALAWLAQNDRIDLIMLDIRMPDMDGYELCKRIKSTASLAATPVIFITSLNAPEDETRGLQVGASDFISRPIVPAVMRARIRSQIDLRQVQAELQSLLHRRADRLERAEKLMAQVIGELEVFQSG